jgi:hypothetical protein
MMNTNDVYVASERYADIRRTADKHNATKRMLAAMRTEARPVAHAGQRINGFWNRMRRAFQ